MGSVSVFRKFIQSFGVELGLLGALLVSFYFFKVHGFAITKVPSASNTLSSEARTTIEKIKDTVVQASDAEKAFIKSRREQDLTAYNQHLGQLNYYMRQLIQYSSVNPEVYKQVSEINKNLRAHFEAVNENLTLRQKGKSVSGRLPASAGIIQSLDVLLGAGNPSIPTFLRWDVALSVFAGCLFLVFLSRLWQGQELRQQTQRSQRLQSRSILLDTILNSMSEALIVVDAKGRFTHYNAAAQRIIGTRIKDIGSEASSEELGFYDVASGEIYSRKQLPFHRSLRGEQIDDLEIYVQNDTHAEGVYISVSSRPLNGIDGGIDGALVVFRDVSRRKMIEQEWQRAREAALDASLKKSDFLAAMSHEIRTPMNGVIGMTTLLADTPLNAEQKEYVGTVKRSAESLLMLINDILDYSKIEAGKVTLDPQPFDLHFLVQDVTEIFKPAISEKNVAIRLLINDNTNWYFSA
ncbi:MAG TPA: histidine kinase dimerization/phospho-acceptor domain-containing protein, partial [Bdellovibrio sp.]